MSRPRRGEIWVVTLDLTIGREIRKTRPAVVLSNDINNHYSGTVTVIPVTSSPQKVYPFEVYIPEGEGGLEYDSKAKTDQIRTVDIRRLVRCLGSVSPERILEIERALAAHLDIRLQ